MLISFVMSYEDRCSAVISLHEAGKTSSVTFRLVQNNGYSWNFIKRTIKRSLRQTAKNCHRWGRPKSLSTIANMKRVRARFRRNPGTMTQTSKINRESHRRTVKNKLNLRPFKLPNAQCSASANKGRIAQAVCKNEFPGLITRQNDLILQT